MIIRFLMLLCSTVFALAIFVFFEASYMSIPGRYGFYEQWYITVYSLVWYSIIPGALLTVFLLRKQKWFGTHFLFVMFILELGAAFAMDHWVLPEKQPLTWLCQKEAKSKVVSDDAGASLSVPDVKKCELAPY